ncbi:crossover junction endonuclease EME1, partial [Tachysurus ichikawai]
WERDKTGFSFCLESEWAGGQKVERTGKGLLQVWKRQIQQLNRVSADMATAILSAYPSPQLLIQVNEHFVTCNCMNAALRGEDNRELKIMMNVLEMDREQIWA